MTFSPRLRSRIALAILLAATVLSGMWFWKTYRPRAGELAGRETELARMRTANRDARAREMAMGADSVESLRRRSRGEADQLALRVPPLGGEAGSTQPFVDALSAAARRLGVRVHNYQPLAPSAEGQFQVDGLRVLVAGRYHDVAALMAELLSQPRLTQIRGARLAVVPDSLMNASVAAARPGSAPAFAAPRRTRRWRSPRARRPSMWSPPSRSTGSPSPPPRRTARAPPRPPGRRRRMRQ